MSEKCGKEPVIFIEMLFAGCRWGWVPRMWRVQEGSTGTAGGSAEIEGGA